VVGEPSRGVHRTVMQRRFIAALLLPSACAYYSQEDGERLNNEVYALQTQVTALQQAVSQLQESEKDQSKKIGAMTEEMAELSKVARRNDADLGVQLEEMLQEVARMKGYVETFSERMSDIEAGVSKVQGDLDVRFQQQGADRAKTEEEKKRAVEEAAKRERLFADPEALFKEVENMLGKNEAGTARKWLREFVLRAEDDKKLKKFLDGAGYWIGETYLSEGDFQKAAAEFNKVRKDFPNSTYANEALFKLGVCFENLKLPKDAKLFYESVIKKAPKSKAAEKAKKRLKDLK
jgi:TolA-binding protein